MGSENSKNNSNRLSPTSNSYPFSIDSNNELDYQKHSPESQENHLEDLNENHEYSLPLDFQRDDSNDQTNNKEENTSYESFPKIDNFDGKGEFQTLADEELLKLIIFYNINKCCQLKIVSCGYRYDIKISD